MTSYYLPHATEVRVVKTTKRQHLKLSVAVHRPLARVINEQLLITSGAEVWSSSQHALQWHVEGSRR